MIAACALKGIYKVAKAIYTQVQLVQANPKQCKRLANRIRIVESAIAKLDQIPKSENFEKGLTLLENCLEESLAFISQFADKKKWYQKVVNASRNEERFNELNQQLMDCLPLLQLGLKAHEVIKREEDVADQKADAKALKAGQAELLSLNQRMMQELLAFKGAAAERDKILALQMVSLKNQLHRLSRPAEAKSVIAPRDQIACHEVIFGELLDVGSISRIYSGQWQNQPVAIKLFSAELPHEQSMEFGREVAINSRLRHSNIVRFYGASLEGDKACVIVELMHKGSLCTYLAKNKLTPAQQKQIAIDIAQGLQYLHSNSIIHCDLKSANILLDQQGHAKIADFGLAKTNAYSIQSIGKITLTIPWCAPELLLGEEVTAQADVYGFGVILWELFTGKEPFLGASLHDLTRRILAGEREQIPKDLPEGLGDLIQACWSNNPAERPQLIAIQRWLEQYDLAKFCYNQGKILEDAKEYKQAQKNYQAAADSGFSKALTSLGIFALMGNGGLEKDKAKAYQLFLKAAKEGEPRAMKNLAIMLDSGDGVPKNQVAALAWYGKAGDPESLKRAERLKIKLEEGAKPKFIAITPSPQ